MDYPYVTQSPTPIVLDINEIIRNIHSDATRIHLILNFHEITTFSNANANANAQTLPMMAVPEYFIHYFYANYKIITLCKATYNLYKRMIWFFGTIFNKNKTENMSKNHILKIIYFLICNQPSNNYPMIQNNINIDMASELITKLPLVTDKFLVSCVLNNHCKHDLKNITISIDNLDINYTNLHLLENIKCEDIDHTQIPKQLWYVLLFSKPLLFDKWFKYYHNKMSSKIYKMIIFSFPKLNRKIDVIDFFHNNNFISATFFINVKNCKSVEITDGYLLLLFDKANQLGCLHIINRIIDVIFRSKIKPVCLCFGCILLKYLNWQNIDYDNHKLDRILPLFINNHTCVKCKSDLLPFIYFRAITRGNIFIDKSNYDKLSYIKVLLRADKMDILFRDYDILKENDKIKLHDTLNFHEIILYRYIYNFCYLDNNNFCKILKKNDFNINDKILKSFKITPNIFQYNHNDQNDQTHIRSHNLVEYLVKIDAFKFFSDDEKIHVIKRHVNDLLHYFYFIDDDKYFNQLFKIIPSYGLCIIFWMNIHIFRCNSYDDQYNRYNKIKKKIQIIKLFEENNMPLFKQNILVQNNMMDYINDPFKNDLFKIENIPLHDIYMIKILNVPLSYLTHYIQELHKTINISNFRTYREVIFKYKIPLPLFDEMVLYLKKNYDKKYQKSPDDKSEKKISHNLKFLLSCSEFNTIKHPDVIKIIDKYKVIINDVTNRDEKKKKNRNEKKKKRSSNDSDDSDDSETKSTKKLKK
jgi:hypothetical protein